MTDYTKQIQRIKSKEIKHGNFYHRKVGRVITKWEAIEKNTISLKQHRDNKQF